MRISGVFISRPPWLASFLGSYSRQSFPFRSTNYCPGSSRLRQIESKAVRKLQQPYRCRSLASFLDGVEVPADNMTAETA